MFEDVHPYLRATLAPNERAMFSWTNVTLSCQLYFLYISRSMITDLRKLHLAPPPTCVVGERAGRLLSCLVASLSQSRTRVLAAHT